MGTARCEADRTKSLIWSDLVSTGEDAGKTSGSAALPTQTTAATILLLRRSSGGADASNTVQPDAQGQC
jgi:hypothetical protein